ncbi:hypothetical protein L3Q72_19835 [Vibrio sp. JC009]|uniref:hypothetical protein n=1 Tax=Vibrio sp. JC009 TaxID=2912314 RepID=UPI0023AEE126|nr:hypothetical protein [Vibrio sp. JC009]WED23493.1 hypothetical protein L3Q72_19835 [Vibrio sp. JC009]
MTKPKFSLNKKELLAIEDLEKVLKAVKTGGHHYLSEGQVNNIHSVLGIDLWGCTIKGGDVACFIRNKGKRLFQITFRAGGGAYQARKDAYFPFQVKERKPSKAKGRP